LYQTQTAPTTILAAAANAAHRVFAGAAVAIGAFQDASTERMRLGLEHLRRVRKPKAPPTHEERVADLLDAYADPGLHPDIERIVRMIARKAYKNGFCYATQETIALWTGLPKSTVQLRFEQMEHLKLIHVERRPATSSITILADGTLDALRLKKINKIKARKRTAPYIIRTFTTPSPEELDKISIRSAKKVESWSKNTSCSNPRIATQYIGEDARGQNRVPSSGISAPSSLKATPEIISREEKEEKTPVNIRKNTKNNEKKQGKTPRKILATQKKKEHLHKKSTKKKSTQTPVVKSVTPPQSTSLNGNEEKEKSVPTTVSSRQEQANKTAQLLIDEGVTHNRAKEFAHLFDYQRIRRTIDLDLHRTKQNPPGYLLRLIQDDAASKRIVSGSEADQVRQRERGPALRGRIAPTEAAETREPVPSAVSPPQPKPRAPEAICGTFPAVSEPPPKVVDPLEALSPEDRERYTQRARAEVLRAKPWLGPSPSESNPLMQAMIRTQLRAMLATIKAPGSPGAPSG
jgi:hypothetical protein